MGKTTKEIVGDYTAPLRGGFVLEKTMKSMIALALAGVVAMSTPVLVDAANINASKICRGIWNV